MRASAVSCHATPVPSSMVLRRALPHPACNFLRSSNHTCNTINGKYFVLHYAKKTQVCPAASADAPSGIDKTAATFADLLMEKTGTASLKLKPASHGRGLFIEENISTSGKVLASIPLDTCIVVDYESGLKVPAGAWPRLRRGVAKNDALPWDILLSLALLDGLAGDGDEFWGQYANEVLPQPLDLTQPVCLPENLLRQLQHPAIEEAALQQKERLAQLFPGLASPTCEDGPTWFEWAFACVRSRAFQLSTECFAFVPFLDAANHAEQPNANFQMAADKSAANLISLSSISSGEEITISYTGKEGYTNQRFMAQYGFVPRQGNPFDLLRLSSSYGEEQRPPSPKQQTVLLSLDAMQAVLGDGEDMIDAFSGRDAVTYGALKSLPLAAMESDAGPLADQISLAEQLLSEVKDIQKLEWVSTLEEDEKALLLLEEEGLGGDRRLESVLRYRVHRKRLVSAAERLLTAFIHI